MEKRLLGQTGTKLSVVGFGGIVVMDEEPEQALSFVSKAVQRGINYFDVAPSYGNAEEKLGPALEPYRKDVFLACKTLGRTAEAAKDDLQQSLDRLKTHHLELYQCHAVSKMEDVESILGDGGAIETLIKARERGVVRFFGFSSHNEDAAIALMDRFDFDSVLFPINWACWLKSGFGSKVVEHARRKGVGILALKALAERQWGDGEEHEPWSKCWYRPADTYASAERALRFSLSKPITAAVSPSHADLLWWMCDAAEDLRPLSPEEEHRLAAEAQELDVIFPHD